MFRNASSRRSASTLLVALGLALGVAGCDIEQTREGEMPEVEVRGGQLPEYEVETPEVEVRREPTTIEVPEVDIRTHEEIIEVPRVDITVPEDEPEATGEAVEEDVEDTTER